MHNPIVNVLPDKKQMEDLFGTESGLFWTVKNLKSDNPMLLKKLTIESGIFDAFKNTFDINGFKFNVQDCYNLYFISLRMGADRNMNGKATVGGRIRTDGDNIMRKMKLSDEGPSWVIFREGDGYKGNYRGARYRIYSNWIELLTPWLKMEHGLNMKRSRLVVVLLFIASGFDEFEVLFNIWKTESKDERARLSFKPMELPLDKGFLENLDGKLKQQVTKASKGRNPKLKHLQDFLHKVKLCNSFPIKNEGMPQQILRILASKNSKDVNNLFKEDIEYILYRLKCQNKKRDCQEMNAWPTQFELLTGDPKIRIFANLYEKHKKRNKVNIGEKLLGAK